MSKKKSREAAFNESYALVVEFEHIVNRATKRSKLDKLTTWENVYNVCRYRPKGLNSNQ